jgi:hypothetical protein
MEELFPSMLWCDYGRLGEQLKVDVVAKINAERCRVADAELPPWHDRIRKITGRVCFVCARFSEEDAQQDDAEGFWVYCTHPPANGFTCEGRFAHRACVPPGSDVTCPWRPDQCVVCCDDFGSGQRLGSCDAEACTQIRESRSSYRWHKRKDCYKLLGFGPDVGSSQCPACYLPGVEH